jgi:GNAT superfamily N-acetyltransferase
MYGVTLRRAGPDDARRLTELVAASKRSWGYADDLLELWRPALSFTREYIRATEVVVAELGGEPVGVSAFSMAGTTAELDHLWVRPDCLRQGIGRTLFEDLVARARARGALTLDIAADPFAEPFYLRMGARRSGSVSSVPEGRRLPRLVLEIDHRPVA